MKKKKVGLNHSQHRSIAKFLMRHSPCLLTDTLSDIWRNQKFVVLFEQDVAFCSYSYTIHNKYHSEGHKKPTVSTEIFSGSCSH